jgi:hypothetical protein
VEFQRGVAQGLFGIGQGFVGTHRSVNGFSGRGVHGKRSGHASSDMSCVNFTSKV